jgi:transcription initiation factor TFIIH subunit 4
MAEQTEVAARDAALALAMRVAALSQGSDHATELLDEPQRRALADLGMLGLVYRRKANSRRYYATPLAASLASDTQGASSAASAAATASASAAANSGVILETNFRVYAHMPPAFAARLLSLFMQVDYVLPNLVVGRLSRRTIQAADASGISVDDIVGYLTRNAHPLMRSQVPLLPETVVSQLHLWSAERRRVTATRVRLYDEFESHAQFDGAVRYARDAGVHVWDRRHADALCSSLAVHTSAHGLMKEYLRSQR